MTVATIGGVTVGYALDQDPIAGQLLATNNFYNPGVIHQIDLNTGTSSQIAKTEQSANRWDSIIESEVIQTIHLMPSRII